MNDNSITQQEYDKLFVDRQLKAARNHNQLFEKVVSNEFVKDYEKVKDFTMLSIEALYDLYNSVKYVSNVGIDGAIVEVGTWKGGALAISMLADKDDFKREFIGFDTFEGHLEPESDEFDIRGFNMRNRYHEIVDKEGSWCKADFNETGTYLKSIARSAQIVKLHKGDVKAILPKVNIDHIAVLRIDVDWYLESIIALQHLYDKVQKGGVVILDDYGHHSGQRKAFEEFFNDKPLKWTHVNYATIVSIKS